MRQPLSGAEKSLGGALALLFVAVGTFLVWKKASSPLLVGTLLPVTSAQFLADDRILVVTQSPSGPFPVVAVTHTDGAQTSVSRVWDSQINVYSSPVSADGRWWLVRDYNFRNPTISLFDLNSLIQVRTFTGDGSWLDSRHFEIATKGVAQTWGISKQGGLSLQSQHIFSRPTLRQPSPDGKAALRVVEQKKRVLETDTNSSTYSLVPRDYLRSQTTVVAVPGGKPIGALSGDSWRSLSWREGGKQLWGLAFVDGVFPGRGDIMRFDLATCRSTATRLEMPENVLRSYSLSYLEFRFSGDGRILVASTLDGALLVWGAADGHFLRLLPSPNDRFYRTLGPPQISADSRLLLRPTPQGVEIYRTEQFLPRR